jgi:hypothetical protein
MYRVIVKPLATHLVTNGVSGESPSAMRSLPLRIARRAEE